MRSFRALPAALALAGVALTACTPLPDYVPPPVSPVPASAPIPDRLDAVVAGERVRVTVRSGRSTHVLTGQVVAVDSTVLRLTAGARDTFRIERATVAELWVSRGQRSRSGAAGLGLLFGGVAGGGLGYAAGDDCDADAFVCFDRSDTALAGALAGGLLGALVAATLGGGERWMMVPLRGRAMLRIVPEPSRDAGLSLIRIEF